MTDKAAILAEIVGLFGLEPVREGDVTVKDVAKATGVTIETAGRHMNMLVGEGAYTAHDALVNGRRCKVFRKVQAAA